MKYRMDTLIQKLSIYVTKINYVRGDLTDITAKKKHYCRQRDAGDRKHPNKWESGWEEKVRRTHQDEGVPDCAFPGGKRHHDATLERDRRWCLPQGTPPSSEGPLTILSSLAEPKRGIQLQAQLRTYHGL